MGKVLNLSLTPGASCAPGVPCFGDCYARKSAKRSKQARAAWEHNFNLWKSDPREFERSVVEQIEKKQPKFFRWHVAGDIPDAMYLAMMYRVACRFKRTKFLAFTKRYNLVRELPPANMSIVLSAWPGYEIHNPLNLSVAWMQDGTEQRVPQGSLECPGGCDECGMCWSLNVIGRDVVFDKH